SVWSVMTGVQQFLTPPPPVHSDCAPLLQHFVCDRFCMVGDDWSTTIPDPSPSCSF
ncbi:hypothetical protein J6590_105070, partial [Homalodisca vitripennis]